MTRIIVCGLVTLCFASPVAFAQSTPSISWNANEPTVDGQFRIAGSGTVTLPQVTPPTNPPTTNWAIVSLTLHAMNRSAKRIYSGVCAAAIADGQFSGTWTGNTQTSLPNGDYDVWILLQAKEGTAASRFFTAAIKPKSVTGSTVPAWVGGTIAFANLTRNGTTVSSTNGPFTLAVEPTIPPAASGWDYTLAPGLEPFQIFAFPTPGGEVLKGTATEQPNSKWNGSVSNVPAGFLMLGTMGVKGHGSRNLDDHVIGTGFDAPK